MACSLVARHKTARHFGYNSLARKSMVMGQGLDPITISCALGQNSTIDGDSLIARNVVYCASSLSNQFNALPAFLRLAGVRRLFSVSMVCATNPQSQEYHNGRYQTKN